MKIELTLPALERLLAGDSELEIAARKQIVLEFTKRHLTGVANEELMKQAILATKSMIDQAVKDTLDVDNLLSNNQWPYASVRLKQMIREVVEKSTQEAVDKALAGIIQYQKRYWDKNISSSVDKALEANIAARIEEGVQARLKKALGPEPE